MKWVGRSCTILFLHFPFIGVSGGTAMFNWYPVFRKQRVKLVAAASLIVGFFHF